MNQCQQEHFEQLVNLIVIFSKILKQMPLFFETFEQSLRDIVNAYSQGNGGDVQFCAEILFPGIMVEQAITNPISIDQGGMNDSTFNHTRRSYGMILLVNSLFTLLSLSNPEATQKETK